ncbi:uncharacterized protein A1O9_05462 [Exophiala aquamarina CBS 119918]|uniref:MOSC domain-containing protein n=1 Tax=Exophiala aquamarina CBS 119918 TaxID=1182545 RepID=A0A072PPV1_9EURO|nr:uncharacterized protein A1O9_05462 [Exophiala aquamarina CBS 119918]KEF57545.1 hypothetical protein A1O9_05462 [Exophiala aquamarina CBS 119918]
MSVISLSLSTDHVFSKTLSSSLNLLPDLGVEGDCHCGKTVQHRSRLHIRPPPKNLRQVHLIDLEILEQFDVKPGDLGENVTTRGLRLLERPTGTKLHFLPQATTTVEDTTIAETSHPVVVLTGLRNPCPQIQKFRSGLQEKFIVRDEERKIVERKAGVMSTVEVGGVIEVGMRVLVEEPDEFQQLQSV